MGIHLSRLLAVCAACAATAFANAPFATASFFKEDVKTGKHTPITSARLDDYVCLVIRDSSTPDGDHSLRLAIYDGGGREVYQSIKTITAVDRKWSRMTCFGFNDQRDLPGTWWYVAELDDEPLVSKEIQVSPVS